MMQTEIWNKNKHWNLWKNEIQIFGQKIILFLFFYYFFIDKLDIYRCLSDNWHYMCRCLDNAHFSYKKCKTENIQQQRGWNKKENNVIYSPLYIHEFREKRRLYFHVRITELLVRTTCSALPLSLSPLLSLPLSPLLSLSPPLSPCSCGRALTLLTFSSRRLLSALLPLLPPLPPLPRLPLLPLTQDTIHQIHHFQKDERHFVLRCARVLLPRVSSPTWVNELLL